jgi:hypothetical protein
VSEIPQDPATPTTIQISRGQRRELTAIAAELTAAKGRPVGTKEAFSDLIEFWKERHRDAQ